MAKIKIIGKLRQLKSRWSLTHGFRDSVPVRKSRGSLLGHAKISSKASRVGSGFHSEKSI